MLYQKAQRLLLNTLVANEPDPRLSCIYLHCLLCFIIVSLSVSLYIKEV